MVGRASARLTDCEGERVTLSERKSRGGGWWDGLGDLVHELRGEGGSASVPCAAEVMTSVEVIHRVTCGGSERLPETEERVT